jgi:hypothetical protein
MITPIAPKRGSVYVVSFNGFFKIGRSQNPQVRLKQIVPANFPISAELVFSKEVPHAPYVEKVLHETYKHLRATGEWFRLTPQDLEAIPTVVDEIDYSPALKIGESSRPSKRLDASVTGRNLTNKFARCGDMIPARYIYSVLSKKYKTNYFYTDADWPTIKSVGRKLDLWLNLYDTGCQITLVSKMGKQFR